MSKRYAVILVFVTVIILAMTSSRSYADRVYRLLNNPEYQAGFLLSGTIVTADTAALDEQLDISEILSWQWTISGGRDYSMTSEDLLTDLSVATGVQITDEWISLPFGPTAPELATLILSGRTPAGRGALVRDLSWETTNVSGLFLANSQARREEEGGAFDTIWSGPADSPGPRLIIAVAVP